MNVINTNLITHAHPTNNIMSGDFNAQSSEA